MAQKTLSHKNAVNDAPTYKLIVNEVPVEELLPVLGISVQRAYNKISTARIILRDGQIGGGQTKKTDFPHQNKTTFQPGNRIEIKIGHRGKNTYSVFKGIITGLQVRIRQNSSKLIIDAKSEAFRMTLQPKSRYYEDRTDSEIMNDLTSAYALVSEVDETHLRHAELVQYECSDWRFLLNRAEHNGLFVHIDEADQILIQKPDFLQEPIDILEYGKNIYELDAEIDARLQFEGATAQSWDFTSQSLLQQESIPPASLSPQGTSGEDLAEVGNDASKILRHSGFKLDGELQAKADAVLLRDRMATIRGRVRVKTTGKINPGDRIDLLSLGDRFSGIALVSGVRYELSREGWLADIQFGFSNKWKQEELSNSSSTSLSDFLPAVSGLQIGLVSQIHEDPEESNRIRVRLPMVDISHDGVWARIATLDAGSNRGSFFLPEIDDEVIVGFLNDDPREAIILGMLHSSAKAAPLTAEEENPQKGFFSREGVKIVFDDEKKSLIIATPGGNKLVLSDDEEMISLETSNGNKLILSDQDSLVKMQSGNGNKLEIHESNGVILGDSSANTKILGLRIDLNE